VRWQLVLLTLFGGLLLAADHPQDEISNGVLRVRLYTPDAQSGYYRGTRFDWSGMIFSLQYQGHNYYGPWYDKMDPAVSDFVYRDSDIVAGPCSWATGPAEEFEVIGYNDAAPQGTFIKIGVGRLRKPDSSAYDHYRLYEIADGGKWSVHKTADRAEFVQDVGRAGEYTYMYRKVVRLAKDKPQMVIEHSVKNTGRKPIVTNAYVHNFLVLDKLAPGPGLTISFPFAVKAPPLTGDLARIEGNRIVYLKTLTGEDRVTTPIEGFGSTAKDYDIRFENRQAGMGLRITGDRPIIKAGLWSIRSNVSVEPYVEISVAPGKEFTWNLTYDYFALKQ
jgi:hypothetical protein